MSTSREHALTRRRSPGQGGFSFVELILGIALTLCLALAVAPLWLSLQSVGGREAERAVRLLQARVAVARFERDLRLASAVGSPFPSSTAVLEASRSQVVFLVRSAAGAVPVLVEWEIAGGGLMRRRGPCPGARPAVFRHSLFVDHKTMLEGIASGSSFTYKVGGAWIDPAHGTVDVASVEGVLLDLRIGTDRIGSPQKMSAVGRVGK